MVILVNLSPTLKSFFTQKEIFPHFLSFEIKSYNKLSHFPSCPDVKASMNKTKTPLVPLSCKGWFQLGRVRLKCICPGMQLRVENRPVISSTFTISALTSQFWLQLQQHFFFSSRPPSDKKISGLLKQEVELKGFGRTRFARFCRPER